MMPKEIITNRALRITILTTMAEWNDLVNEILNQHWYKELPYKVAIKVISDAIHLLISSWVWILKSELKRNAGGWYRKI